MGRPMIFRNQKQSLSNGRDLYSSSRSSTSSSGPRYCNMCDAVMPRYDSDGDEVGQNCRQCVPVQPQFVPLSAAHGFGFYNGIPVYASQPQMQVLPNGEPVMTIQYMPQMYDLRYMC